MRPNPRFAPTDAHVNPITHQTAALTIDQDLDYISDVGSEVWNVLEQLGVRNALLVGVHTNMCVLGRPFGLRQLARLGKNVALVRDMTDTMYNPAMAPFVDHFEGNKLVCDYIERTVCPTTTSDSVLGGAAFAFAGAGAAAAPIAELQASLLLQPGGGTTGLAAPPAGAAATPFVLLAHVKVHAHLLPEHAAYAAEIDGVVEHSEPGMLYHSMDQDPANPCRYTWTEIYRDDAALLAHFDNPAVKDAMGPKTDMYYDGGIGIVIYGEVSEATKVAVAARGIQVTYHDKVLGYGGLQKS